MNESELRAELAAKAHEIEDLLNENRELRQKIEDLQSIEETLREKINNLKDTIVDLRD